MANIYTSADQLIGKTPLLELTHIERSEGLEARILAKLEYLNPAGSVKDLSLIHILFIQKLGELPVESFVVLVVIVCRFQFNDRVHQRLGDILSPVDAEA